MYSASIKKRLSDLLALSALLLFIVLEVIGCKDVEDCRSLYDTPNVYKRLVRIKFKGTHPLSIGHAKIVSASDGEKKLEDSVNPNDKTKIQDALKNLKEKKLFCHLSPEDTSITLLLYKTSTDTRPATITLHYQIKHFLLSPNCGIQRVFVINKVETSFESSTILVPEGKISIESDNPHVEISY